MAIPDPSLAAYAAIISVPVLFLLYIIIVKSNIIAVFQSSGNIDPAIPFFILKLTGFVLFGIVPFILFTSLSGCLPAKAVLTTGTSGHLWHVLVCLILLVTVITFYTSRSKALQARSPQLRIKVWSITDFLISISGWVIYLFGYEYLFRGILWITCYTAFGFWPALSVNVLLYSMAHIDQGLAMSAGAVPVGIVFCILALLTGSFLPAFLLHTWMAVCTEIFSVYHNPEITVRIKLKGLRL